MQQQARESDELLTRLLEGLDRAETEFRGGCRRAHRRFKYRAGRLQLTLFTERGSETLSAIGRNVSGGGVSILVGRFVYAGQRCTVRLVTVRGEWHTVNARVVRCRYIEGTAGLHEVGLRFDRDLHVAMFHRAATPIHLLVVHEDPLLVPLLDTIIDGFDVRFSSARDREAAILAATATAPSITLIDLDATTLDGLELVKDLRNQYFFRPIVVVSASHRPFARDAALEAGASEFLAKPLDRSRVIATLESLNDDPLVSTLSDDATMAELIDEFVERLPGFVAQLQAAHRNRDQNKLADLALTLQGMGGTYGFEPISEAAAYLRNCTLGGAEPAVVREAFSQLIRWCISARPVRPLVV